MVDLTMMESIRNWSVQWLLCNLYRPSFILHLFCFPYLQVCDQAFGRFFFFFFYSHLTPHSPTGMAGGSPRLTNTCAPTTTTTSYKGMEQTIGPKGNRNPVTRQTEQLKSTERKGTWTGQQTRQTSTEHSPGPEYTVAKPLSRDRQTLSRRAPLQEIHHPRFRTFISNRGQLQHKKSSERGTGIPT